MQMIYYYRANSHVKIHSKGVFSQDIVKGYFPKTVYNTH